MYIQFCYSFDSIFPLFEWEMLTFSQYNLNTLSELYNHNCHIL